MTFEEWKQEQCLPDNLPHLDIVKEAWQAATLAERERCAQTSLDHECSCNNGCCSCDCSWTQEMIAAAIRKGEVV